MSSESKEKPCDVGSGVMPVEIAATRGERFTKDGSPSSEYQDVRATAVLGKRESKAVVLICPFEPARVVVDPDARILQLRRNNAVEKL